MAPQSIDWSIEQDRRELEQFTLTNANTLTADYGQVAFERVEAAPDVIANLVEIDSHRPFELASDLRSQGDRICLQVTLVGQCELDMEDGADVSYAAGTSLAHAVRGTSARFRFAPNQRLRTLTFTFSHDAFADRLSGHVSEALQTMVDEPSNPRAFTRLQTPDPIWRMANIAFREKLTGPLRSMQIDGLSRMVMAHFLAGLSDQAEARQNREIDRVFRDRLHDIRARILSDPLHLPTLDELAGDAGVDHKRLNAGFRELFGTTVFEFCRNHRLDRARISLLERELHVKEAAYEAGYAHVSNFVTAYRRRFGVPPGLDRKRAGTFG